MFFMNFYSSWFSWFSHSLTSPFLPLPSMLPEMDGLEICQEIRSETDVSVIFITSKGEIMDVVMGLGVGGDDYIRKPFDLLEVIARIRPHLHR